MSKTAYLSAIAEAERELDELKKEHADLLRKISVLQNFIQSGTALTNSDGAPFGSTSPQASVLNSAATSIPAAAQSIADQVAEILRASPKPLHVTEIVRQLRAVRTLEAKNPRGSVLVAMKRRKGQFRRVRPGTFALASERDNI